jgi:hypothetical protein
MKEYQAGILAGLRALHTAHRAELEKARRPEAQNARHHAWL